ncbi:DUF535 domain-containing protein [Albitalea terrae]|uniref:DUF535 domain-containing protein n=1 Tax=Piscinibacter terrae TaxID=2496871 RepID=A0A3N7HVF1_9BURK|nr:DUF535 domain-containing protein [Albitalea terrae]
MTVSKTASEAAPNDTTNTGQGLMAAVRRFWAWSGKVCEQTGLRRLRARVGFVVKALALREDLDAFAGARPGSPLARAFEQRPEMVGAAVWPYICARWDGQRRLAQIRSHYDAVDAIGGVVDFPIDQSRQLLDLAAEHEGLKVVLDQPRWFMREGQLVLNLFAGDVRIYSIAFSLGRENGATVAWIGAIQGGNSEGVMADYKDLTKALHGMRPRDFLVELVRSLCRSLGVSKIMAVADASRQHRAAYFGAAKSETLSLNYDEIWTERGAQKVTDDFFSLAIEAPLKSLDDVPSKKRAMYRRRYELLESLDSRIAEAVAAGKESAA